MADKYIALINGVDQEVEGTVTGGTPTQAGDLVALDNSGRLDSSVLPVGVGADVFVTTAFETLAAGAFVYIRPDGSAANASGNSGGNAAIGFVLAGSAAAAPATVYFDGQNNALTGLTPGARYYLSDSTPGAATATPVVGAGKIHQFLGRAISATTISFEADDFIVRA